MCPIDGDVDVDGAARVATTDDNVVEANEGAVALDSGLDHQAIFAAPLHRYHAVDPVVEITGAEVGEETKPAHIDAEDWDGNFGQEPGCTKNGAVAANNDRQGSVLGDGGSVFNPGVGDFDGDRTTSQFGSHLLGEAGGTLRPRVMVDGGFAKASGHHRPRWE